MGQTEQLTRQLQMLKVRTARACGATKHETEDLLRYWALAADRHWSSTACSTNTPGYSSPHWSLHSVFLFWRPVVGL